MGNVESLNIVSEDNQSSKVNSKANQNHKDSSGHVNAFENQSQTEEIAIDDTPWGQLCAITDPLAGCNKQKSSGMSPVYSIGVKKRHGSGSSHSSKDNGNLRDKHSNQSNQSKSNGVGKYENGIFPLRAPFYSTSQSLRSIRSFVTSTVNPNALYESPTRYSHSISDYFKVYMIDIPIAPAGIGLVISTTDDEECTLDLPPHHNIEGGHLYVKAFKMQSDGSPMSAQRAGLKLNDLIICVDGSQSVSRLRKNTRKDGGGTASSSSSSSSETHHSDTIEDMISAIRGAKGLVTLTILRKTTK